MIPKSLVVPVYRNEDNIAELVAAVSNLASQLTSPFEAVFVIDGSPDRSGTMLQDAVQSLPFECTIIYHSRNFGAFQAIRTGMQASKGRHVAVMAADLQEPPELVLSMFEALALDEADIVFGKRSRRRDAPFTTLSSNVYWALYRRFVVKDVPPGGVDIFACNRHVLNAVLAIEEPNGSLISQLFWVGFRRKFIPYDRRARIHGNSAWSLAKRFEYMLDSIFSYTDLPIMLILWIGAIGSVFSVTLGLWTAISRLFGHIDESGYTTLLLLVLIFGSMILLVQGVLGCYIWRISENTKRRPMTLVSNVIKFSGTNDT